MTIHAARLHTLATLATHAAHQWPTYETTEATLALPITAGAGAGLGRSNAVPDPTFMIVASHQRYSEACTLIIEATGLIRMLQQQIDTVIRENRSTYEAVATAVRNARCSGEIDPLCADNAVRAGLCWRCYQRRRRYGVTDAVERTTAERIRRGR